LPNVKFAKHLSKQFLAISPDLMAAKISRYTVLHIRVGDNTMVVRSCLPLCFLDCLHHLWTARRSGTRPGTLP